MELIAEYCIRNCKLKFEKASHIDMEASSPKYNFDIVGQDARIA